MSGNLPDGVTPADIDRAYEIEPDDTDLMDEEIDYEDEVTAQERRQLFGEEFADRLADHLDEDFDDEVPF